jgi:hypothetical protein
VVEKAGAKEKEAAVNNNKKRRQSDLAPKATGGHQLRGSNQDKKLQANNKRTRSLDLQQVTPKAKKRRRR